MASPAWKYPGVLEGRITPANSAIETGSAYGYAYSGYYWGSSYYGYNYYTNHAFCLGEDMEPMQDRRFKVGDAIAVQQTFTPVAGHSLVHFDWHMRTPEEMAESRNILSAGSVSFIRGNPFPIDIPATNVGIVEADDGCRGIAINQAPLSPFDASTDDEQTISISGATDPGNNGQFSVTGIPDAGLYAAGRTALVDIPAMVHRLNDPAVTLRMLGLVWIGRVYVDDGAGWEEYMDSVEYAGHTYVRNRLSINISKLIGAISVKFELKLELLA